MMAESRPLYLLLCLIGAPLRLRRRYQADPLPTGTLQTSSTYMSANRKLRSSKLFGRSGPTYTPYHMMAESRPLYLLLHLIEGTSSTTATVSSPSIANRHSANVVYIYVSQSQITRSSKLFGRSGPTYTPYHMMAESRPLYLLLHHIEGTSSTTATASSPSIANRHVKRRLHICQTIANYTQ